MRESFDRRQFLGAASVLAVSVGLGPLACRAGSGGAADDPPPASRSTALEEPMFRISLAQWSLHKRYFGGDPGAMGWDVFARKLYSDDYRSLLAGDLDPLDFPRLAREEFDIDAVEYVNTFYFDRAQDTDYLRDLKGRADGAGVRSLLIMCDGEGALGAADESARTSAVERHHKWVEAARFLGCHAIRVNAQSDRSLPPDEQQRLAADGLRRLCEFADPHEIDVIVENHGGLSSNGQWLAGVIRSVDHPRAGTLPDFGNFFLTDFPLDPREHPEAWYDRYRGVEELMPYARAVSAKAREFDAAGDCVETDFARMMKIVLDAGYRGYLGIEYEGSTLGEMDGIRATKRLLERVRAELS